MGAVFREGSKRRDKDYLAPRLGKPVFSGLLSYSQHRKIDWLIDFYMAAVGDKGLRK